MFIIYFFIFFKHFVVEGLCFLIALNTLHVNLVLRQVPCSTPHFDSQMTL